MEDREWVRVDPSDRGVTLQDAFLEDRGVVQSLVDLVGLKTDEVGRVGLDPLDLVP